MPVNNIDSGDLPKAVTEQLQASAGENTFHPRTMSSLKPPRQPLLLPNPLQEHRPAHGRLWRACAGGGQEGGVPKGSYRQGGDAGLAHAVKWPRHPQPAGLQGESEAGGGQLLMPTTRISSKHVYPTCTCDERPIAQQRRAHREIAVGPLHLRDNDGGELRWHDRRASCLQQRGEYPWSEGTLARQGRSHCVRVSNGGEAVMDLEEQQGAGDNQMHLCDTMGN